MNVNLSVSQIPLRSFQRTSIHFGTQNQLAELQSKMTLMTTKVDQMSNKVNQLYNQVQIMSAFIKENVTANLYYGPRKTDF